MGKVGTMTKEIKLSKGFVAIVDDTDYDFLMQWKWYAQYNTQNKKYYAARRYKVDEPEYTEDRKGNVWMHRVILGIQGNNALIGDHIDLDTLNNTRSNLRITDRVGNGRNRGILSNNKSGYKGVSYFKRDGIWTANIRVNKKLIFLGRFKNPEDAHKAYCDAALEYFGEFARFE